MFVRALSKFLTSVIVAYYEHSTLIHMCLLLIYPIIS